MFGLFLVEVFVEWCLHFQCDSVSTIVVFLLCLALEGRKDVNIGNCFAGLLYLLRFVPGCPH